MLVRVHTNGRGWCIKNATGENTLKEMDIFLPFWVPIGYKSNISLDLHTIEHLNAFLRAKSACISKISNMLVNSLDQIVSPKIDS